MAPVLQCPDCATKHSLDVAAGRSSFRCSGCGRVLKVPERFRPPAPTVRPGSSDAPPPPRGRTTAGGPATATFGRERLPAPKPNGMPTRRVQRALAGSVPFWARALLWLVAVPLGFVVVFGSARAAGALSTNQLQDLFLETGWNRFWPVARLLPFVALVTAATVHFSVLGLSRWRAGRATQRVASAPHGRAAAREPARPAS